MTNIASSVFTNFPAPPENSNWGLLAWADFPDLCWKPRSVSSLVHDDPQTQLLSDDANNQHLCVSGLLVLIQLIELAQTLSLSLGRTIRLILILLPTALF